MMFLIVFFSVGPTCKIWLSNRPKAIQILIVIGLTGLIIAIGSLSVLFQETNPETKAIAREFLSQLMVSSGIFCGLAFGVICMQNQKPLQIKVIWWKQLIKIGIGLLSFLVYMLISEIPEKLWEVELAGRLLFFLANVGLGVWSIYLAPLLFLKFRLVQVECVRKTKNIYGEEGSL